MEKLTVKEGISLLTEFCEIHKRIPRHVGSGKPESILSNFIISHRFNPTVIELKEKYRRTRTADESTTELIEFINTYKHLPLKSSDDPLERRLNSFMNRHRYDEVVLDLIDKYRSKRYRYATIAKKTRDEWIRDLIKFCEKNGRLPRSDRDKEELKLANFKNRNLSDPMVINIVAKYRKKRVSLCYDDHLKGLKEFVSTYNRLPRTTGDKNEGRLQSFISRYKNDESVKLIVDEYRCYNTFNVNLRLLTKFIDKYRRLPRYSSINREEYKLCQFMKRHKEYVSIQILMRRYEK